MAQSPGGLRTDFDGLAALDADGWDHNVHYHPFLLRHLPPRCRAALDVGCGSGTFLLHLAQRADAALGIDLSPEMVRRAQARLAAYPTAEARVADVADEPLPRGHFDCVATIATLHHLPLRATLARLADLVRPGGTLVVLDLYQPAAPADWLVSAAAVPATAALRAVRRGRLRPPREVREAWRAHAETDVYPTLAEVRRAAADLLPGARVRRHLLWRYSLVWRKPGKPAADA
jgi:SAM-dependent methyltransferase